MHCVLTNADHLHSKKCSQQVKRCLHNFIVNTQNETHISTLNYVDEDYQFCRYCGWCPAGRAAMAGVSEERPADDIDHLAYAICCVNDGSPLCKHIGRKYEIMPHPQELWGCLIRERYYGNDWRDTMLHEDSLHVDMSIAGGEFSVDEIPEQVEPDSY